MVLDSQGVEIKIGDSVMLRDREINGKRNPNYMGIVKDVNPDRLPLIDVDCGDPFLRGFPHTDIVHIEPEAG